MDAQRRDQIKRHLEEAERHIAQGHAHIATQTRLIAELERDGHDTALAKELLGTLYKTQQTHEEHRKHILQELGSGPGVQGET